MSRVLVLTIAALALSTSIAIAAPTTVLHQWSASVTTRGTLNAVIGIPCTGAGTMDLELARPNSTTPVAVAVVTIPLCSFPVTTYTAHHDVLAQRWDFFDASNPQYSSFGHVYENSTPAQVYFQLEDPVHERFLVLGNVTSSNDISTP